MVYMKICTRGIADLEMLGGNILCTALLSVRRLSGTCGSRVANYNPVFGFFHVKMCLQDSVEHEIQRGCPLAIQGGQARSITIRHCRGTAFIIWCYELSRIAILCGWETSEDPKEMYCYF